MNAIIQYPNRAARRKNRAAHEAQQRKAHEAQQRKAHELQREFDLAENDNRECYADVSERLTRYLWFHWYTEAYPSGKHRGDLPPPWHGGRPLIREVELEQEWYLISPY